MRLTTLEKSCLATIDRFLVDNPRTPISKALKASGFKACCYYRARKKVASLSLHSVPRAAPVVDETPTEESQARFINRIEKHNARFGVSTPAAPAKADLAMDVLVRTVADFRQFDGEVQRRIIRGVQTMLGHLD